MAEISTERITGAVLALGAVAGHMAAQRSDAYGIEHSVALSLAYRELSATLNEWIEAAAAGGDLPWSLDA